MGISIKNLNNGEGVEIFANGVVRGDEVIAAHDEIYDERRLGRQKYQIVNKSGCTEYAVTADHIAKIAELDRKASLVNPNIIVAIIESRSLQFSLTELWQAHLADCSFLTRSFQDRDTALAWITEQIEGS